MRLINVKIFFYSAFLVILFYSCENNSNPGFSPNEQDFPGGTVNENPQDDPVNTDPQISAINPINNSQGLVGVNGSVAISVVASDADGDTLDYQYDIDPNDGAIVGSGANVTYTAPNQNGTYKFSVTVSDDAGGTVLLNKTITVNDAPVLNSSFPSTIFLDQGDDWSFTVDGSDPNGDVLVYQISALFGSIVDNGNGSFTYTAPNSPVFFESITYRVDDTFGAFFADKTRVFVN